MQTRFEQAAYHRWDSTVSLCRVAPMMSRLLKTCLHEIKSSVANKFNWLRRSLDFKKKISVPLKLKNRNVSTRILSERFMKRSYFDCLTVYRKKSVTLYKIRHVFLLFIPAKHCTPVCENPSPKQSCWILPKTRENIHFYDPILKISLCTP